MASVDNRVVSMVFDNASFERNIAGTISSLDHLKRSLDFSNAKNNFADLNTASKGFNLESVGAAVDGISAKFLALSTIAITALSNIVNRAVNAGITITKSLSLDPIMGGFREYETNMNSIQTILANTSNKGGTLQTVNAALDELNTYSDQTIYNFSEMARNIGTFTAAGVDLDTSVNAIKGIANLAAISGSNSQQASTAMYQLSQALAAGSVKLMDWNSIVNAGMGGQIFQEALFETGKALGTIKDTPIDRTFEEWTAAGNTFRGSLETGWLTADVLTNTLSGFTGDLTESQVLALGYTKEQAAEILKMGEIGQDAATKVKTLTQLLDTVKESVGSGWSQSFRIIIGDFEEAKSLFSEIGAAAGTMVGESADARNNLLQSWKNMGGRTLFINGLRDAFTGIASIIEPIKNAFRDIFPKTSVEDLLRLTQRFAEFAKNLKISGYTAYKIHAIFKGVFSVFQIGWEILKNVGRVIVELTKHFVGSGDGILDTGEKFGKFLTNLNDVLVEGGKIRDFFDGLIEAIKNPIVFIENLKAKFLELFNNGTIPGAEALTNIFDRLKQRFESLDKIADKVTGIWDFLSESLSGVAAVLDEVWTYIKEWFSTLGADMAEAAEPGDFDAVVDVVNVGLLGGIAAILANFMRNGLSLDFGGGFMKGVTGTLESLTGTLDAMQTKLKADTLLRIAAAIGIIAASVLVLSLIDSDDLAKALAAIAVGFGQLVGAMALLSQISSGPTGAASMVVLAGGLILLGGAILILSFAVKNLADLSWEDLAKGLTGVTVLLGVLSAAVIPLSANSSGMVRAGIGMIGIAIALNIMALAVKSFAEMDWEDMARGLTGVAVGLGAITLAVNFMPPGMVSKGLGIIAIAVGLNILALAVKSFAEMKWEDMGKGMAGVAGGLLIIAAAVNLMPATTIFTAAGILAIAIALGQMVDVVKELSGMSWEELGKGLAGIAGVMLILALAVNAMSGALTGAVALVVVSAALLMLAEALQEIGGMKLKDIGKALLGIAGVLAVLGVATALMTPIIPAMVALGAALVLVGAGFILFGAGAYLTARALEILASAGSASLDILFAALDGLLERLPTIVTSLALAAIAFAQVFLDAAPVLLESLGILIAQILDTIIQLAPKLGETLITLIDTGIAVIREKFPDLVAVGFELLIAFLTGLRDNIAEVTTLVSDIIIEFLNALEQKIGDIVEAGIGVLTSFIDGVVQNIGELATASADIIAAIVQGISDNITKIVEAGTGLVVDFIKGITKGTVDIIAAGTDLIVDLITGIGNAAEEIVTAGVDAVISFIEGIGKNAVELADAAMGVIVDFVDGLAVAIDENAEDLREAGKKLAFAIADGATLGLASKAGSIANGVGGMFTGGINKAKSILGINSPSRVFMGIGRSMAEGVVLALDRDTTAVNSVAGLGNRVISAMERTLSAIPTAILDIQEFAPVISPVLDLTGIQRDAKDLNNAFKTSSIEASLSYDQANVISLANQARQNAETAAVEETPANDIKFEQNIFAPTALSTDDIYRQTRSQIAIAKLELSIP